MNSLRKPLRAGKVRKLHAAVVRAFAQRLREFRVSRGMTQVELARKAGITVAYVSRLELAGATPGIDLVANIAVALGVPTAELLPVEIPDSAPILRAQVTARLQSIINRADTATLAMLAPLLAVIDDGLARRG
jgi:transcriptional regulator with XRE-family HTH domain